MVEGLGAENLLGRVDLTVFYVAFVAGGENHDGVLPQDLDKVIVEIPGVVHRVCDKQRGSPCGLMQGQPSEKHRGGGACQSSQVYLRTLSGQFHGPKHPFAARVGQELSGQGLK